MTPYLDAGFLLTIFVRTSGTSIAHRVLRESAPFSINLLHQLQTENLLVSLRKSAEPVRQTVGIEGQRLWSNYLAEGVLRLVEADWEKAFRLAIFWNLRHPPTPPLLLVHPALAALTGATDFFSFDPARVPWLNRLVCVCSHLRLKRWRPGRSGTRNAYQSRQEFVNRKSFKAPISATLRRLAEKV